MVIAAGNLYENAREISRPRISSDHTYENFDAIMYEDMLQKQEREVCVLFCLVAKLPVGIRLSSLVVSGDSRA